MADYSDLKNKFKTDDTPTGDDYGELIQLAGDAKDTADSAVPDNGDGSVTINNKKIIPASKDYVVSDNKDNTITVNGKTYVPVADNQNGTITVNTQTYMPADASKVVVDNKDGSIIVNNTSYVPAKQSDIQYQTTLANMRRLGQKYVSPGGLGASAQGFCALNSETVVQYCQNTSGHDQQQGILKKFNVKTGDEILSNTIKGYHGNSMTYNSNNGMCYLAMAEDTGGTETAQRTKVLQIDPSDLTIKNTIDLTSKTSLPIIHCIGYDSKDNIYVVGNNSQMEFYDSSWNLKFSKNWVDILGYTPAYMQGVQVNGNVLYWIGGRKSEIWVYTIDYENKNIIFKTQYSFNDFQENLYPTGEIQGIGFNNDAGEVYLTSSVSIAGWVGFTQYFVTSMAFKTIQSGPSLVPYVYANTLPIKFYVGGSGTSYNPDGSQGNPFNSLLEAETCLMSPSLPSKKLTLLGNTSEILVMTKLDNFEFDGNGFTVRAAVVANCKNSTITNLSTVGYSGYKNAALYIYDSIIRINSQTSTGLSGISAVSYEDIFENSTVTNTVSLTDIRTSLVKSNLYLTAPSTKVYKDGLSKVYGLVNVGTFTDIKNPTNVDLSNMLDYNTVNIIAHVTTSSGSNLGFKGNSMVNSYSSVINLTTFTISANVVYLLVMHYVRDIPANSTFQVYKMSDFSLMPTNSYSTTIYLSD